MKNARRMPQWAEDFKALHGVYPIAGGSSNEPPPAQEETPPSGGVKVETPPKEEPETPPTQTPAAQNGFQQGANADGKTFTEEDLERARKQEKDKLYGRIEEMDNQLKAMREAEEARQKAIQEEEERQKTEAEKKAEEEMELRDLLAKKDEEYQTRFQQMQEELAQRDAVIAREREFQSLEAYRQQKLAEHEDDIMPELRDLVEGNSPEEIDASVSALVEKTSRIIGQVAATQQQARQQMPGPRVTAPAMGPLEQNETANQTMTADDIAKMDMKTYREYRDRLLQGASQKAREGGLYG